MSELKFKLKKGGKCVGYMRIVTGDSEGPHIETRTPDGDWESPYTIDWDSETHKHWAYITLDFDSIHSLVCTDRNGKDVYEGDAVRDLRDDGIEMMDLKFWFNSLCEESRHIELLPDEVPE